MQVKYISTTDTARELRKALKDAFPDTRFSVRTDKYAAGASINVEWTDGPTRDEVDPIAHSFECATIDPLTDRRDIHTSEYNGERVCWGADFVITYRTVTPA